MLVSLTVGKVDAGVTVLLTPDKRLIEFPSILLPSNIVSGSIVDITVARNHPSESASDERFAALQDRILSSFGAAEPSTPVLRCRNATQTSVVLEWDPIQLATANLISLSLYRNGQKAGNIPRPLQMHSTKISGLAVDTEYAFHLVLRTSAGTTTSKQVVVRTHKMTDLSGVTITMGVLPPQTREKIAAAIERIGAKLVDSVRIDTTHFVTTEGRGATWEKAVEMNIPVVRPEWVTACEDSGRILGVTKFYLDALRPGPSSESSTPTTATPGLQQTQKELPPAPSSPTRNGEKSDSPANTKESGEGGGREDDKDKNNGQEDKEKAVDEQKEDKEKQNMAIRPHDAVADESYSDNEKQLEPSPGDGASFQDVAL